MKLRSMSEEQDACKDLIKELEKRCPGCTFEVVEVSYVDGPAIRIMEYGRPFIVDLGKMGWTAEEWFRYEVDRRPLEDAPPLMPDDKYRVNCRNCGNVVIGYGNYRDQMAKPDDLWYCPSCGGRASFDDKTYEEWEERENDT